MNSMRVAPRSSLDSSGSWPAGSRPLTPSLKDKLGKAAKQLGDKPNYSWTTTTKEADGTPGRLGPIDGKTEKGSFTFLSLTPGGIPVEVYMKGDKGAAKALEGWQTFDDIAQTGTFDINRKMTVEIKDVGSTKLDVPPEAKAKIS